MLGENVAQATGLSSPHQAQSGGVRYSGGSGGTAVSIFGSGDQLVAFLMTAFYGVTYFFWYYAVTTEQYTSSVAWTLAVFLLAFRWERTRRDRYLLGIAFLAGVGLAHQLTVLFALPPLLWFVLRHVSDADGSTSLTTGFNRRSDRRRAMPEWLRPKLIAVALALAILPLLSYIFIYVRGAQHPEWRGAGQWASAGQWFWSFVSTSQGRSELTWSLTPFLTHEFPSLIWGELTVPGLVAGLIGLAALGKRRAIAVYATLAIYLVFCWIDRLGNWYQVIMPAYALVVMGMAAAASWAWRRSGGAEGQRGGGAGERGSGGAGDVAIIGRRSSVVGAKVQSMSRRLSVIALRTALLLALLALTLYRGAVSYPRADSRNRPDDTGLAPGWAILADGPPTGTAVLGTLPETLALGYITTIWDERPDLAAITSTEARRVLATGRPLAATVAALPLVAAEVSPAARYSALGRTLVAVSVAPNRALPAWASGAQAVGRDFGSELRLVAARLTRDRATGERVALLAWQALQTPTHDWSVSVRLTQGGQEIAQMDHRNPVSGAYPTSRWTPQEAVTDAYTFALPPQAQPDGMTIILYRQMSDGGFLNLDVAHIGLDPDHGGTP